MRNKNISLFEDFFRNKYIIGVLFFDVLIIVATLSAVFHQISKTSVISIDVAPVNATISINGQKNYHNGQYTFTPGTYQIEISHDGLETKTFSVNLESNTFTSITTFLSGPNHSFEFYEQKVNYDSFKKLTAIASAKNNTTIDNDTSAQKFISNYNQVLTINSKLPLKGFVYTEPNINAPTGGYSIQDGTSHKECSKSSCLVIKYYGKDYEEAAIAKIEDAGYSPDDYQIIYERYE